MRKGLEAILVVKKDQQEETKKIEFAAQVIRVDSNGKIYINGGKEDGFILGASVCFSVSSDEELVCGTVQEAEASEADVNVSKEEAEKIKIGMEALLNVEKEVKEEVKEKEDWFR